jgi:hypothetical protein
VCPWHIKVRGRRRAVIAARHFRLTFSRGPHVGRHPPSARRARSSRASHLADAGPVNVTALSGMQAASLLVDAIGHQVANVDTPGYDVDLPAQAARLVQASIAYDANARVQQTQDEVTAAAIDLLA